MGYTVIKQRIGLQSANILCCDLCSSFIAAYDASHCLQLLHPVSLALLQELSTEFARKTHLSLILISPDEQLILCATVEGIVTVIKASSGDVLCRVSEHSGHTVSSAVWQAPVRENDKCSTLVFVGDTTGVVTLINVPTTMVSAFFKTVCTRLLKLDSSISQLDFLDGQLFVSTLSASFICDTRREVFTKVGEKPQYGKFGGCLLRVWPSANDSASQLSLFSKSAVQQCPSSRSSSSCSSIAETFGLDDLNTLVQFEKDYTCLLYSYYFNSLSLSSAFHSKNGITFTNGKRKDGSSMHQPANDVRAARGRARQCSEVRCFSGRPKARIWESDVSGLVLKTHALSDVLSVPPLVMYDSEMDGVITQDSPEKSKPTLDGGVPNGIISIEGKAQNVDMCPLKSLSLKTLNSSSSFQSSSMISFSQICSFQNKFLLLVCTTGLYCYDPITCCIIFYLKICVDGKLKPCGNNLLVFSEGIFTKLTLMNPEVAILALHSLHLLKSCSHIALEHLDLFEHSSVLCRVRNLVIRDILSVLTDANDRQKFEELLTRLTQTLECRPFDDLLPNQGNGEKITSLTAVSVDKSSSEQDSPIESASSRDQDCPEGAANRDAPLPLFRPRPVLGVSCGGILHPSSYRPSGQTVFQDLVESVTSNVSSSSLLSAFSSKVTAVAKRSLDSVTINLNGVSPHQDNTGNRSVYNLDSLLNGNIDLKDDVHLPEDDRALEDGECSKAWLECSGNSSRSDSREGTPNSCEDSRDVRSETDDLVVFRSVRRKKKNRKELHKKIGLKNLSPSLDDIGRSTAVTSSSGVHENVLLGLIKELTVKTMSCKKKMHSTSDLGVLTHWLSEFIQFLKAVSLDSIGRDCALNDQESGLLQLNKLMSNHLSLQKNISRLLVLCLNNKISIDSSPAGNFASANANVDYQFLTSSHERDLDDFFARVFASAYGIIDKEFIINNSSLPALFSCVKTWRVLLNSISEDCAAVCVVQPPPMIDILPALDFSSYQRFTVLIRTLFQDGDSGLVKAAAKLRHSSTVFEMLMVLRSRCVESLSNNQSSCQDCSDPLDVLYLYLTEVCLGSETRAKYMQVWSCSRQLQYDIIHCILKNRKHLLRSCMCGNALPVTLPHDAIFSLLHTAVMGPLYDPSEVCELCRTMGYWRGYSLVFLLHELGQVSDCMPLVLQSCSAESLALLLQAIQPSHVPRLLSCLSSLSEGVAPHDLKCYHCRSVSSIYGGSATPKVKVAAADLETSIRAHDERTSFNELISTEHGSGNDCVLPLPELWARCVEAAVGLVGGSAVLQLLQDLVCRANILPGVIPTWKSATFSEVLEKSGSTTRACVHLLHPLRVVLPLVLQLVP